jgi:hypothetical protein
MMRAFVVFAIVGVTEGSLPCIDVAGVYTTSQSRHVTLSQHGCSGLSSDGWTYTVAGSTATIGNGVVGTVVNNGDGGSSITWSNGITYTKACVDITSVYVPSAAAPDVTLQQNQCHGHSSDGWTYTVVGNQATIDNGITGTISPAGSKTTITWSNGITYTKACLDISGAYTSSRARGITLEQSECRGHSSDGWTFTVAGNKATIDNGITGTILQAGSQTTITWSNDISYTKAAESAALAWMSKNLFNLNGSAVATFLMALTGGTIMTFIAIQRWTAQRMPSTYNEALLVS